MLKFNRINGSALISALFIMTLVAIAATAMTLRTQLDIYRTHLALNSDKRYLASQAVLFWAMDALANKQNKFMILQPLGQVDTYPKSLQNIYPNISIEGELYDLQGKININNIIKNQSLALFHNFFNNILANKSVAERESLLINLSSWVAESPIEGGQDIDDLYYLKQTPPYYSSHLPIANISELRLIQGMDAISYQKISAFITALPETTLPININTASKTVLLSLKEGLDDSMIADILAARKKGINEKLLTPLLKKLGVANNVVTIDSQYFLVVARVKSEEALFTSFSILKREKAKDNNIKVFFVSTS